MGRVPVSQWRRPTDDAYAFALRPMDARPVIPDLGVEQPMRDVAQRALIDGDADRLLTRVSAWSGPEDVGPSGGQPFIAPQDRFIERPWQPLTSADLDEVLCGTARVMRHGHQTDYVLRDHHMLDVVLYHYVTTGGLPTRLFHADRHSDWCRDGYLSAHVPAQAATWWTLLEGIKRPSGDPVLGEHEVVFTTDQPGPEVQLAGRDVGASLRVPWWIERGDLPWSRAIARPEALVCDWVSLDLDYFQPLEQLRLTKGLLREPRFHTLMSTANVRVFVLSPQFTAGGDVLEHWTVAGRRHASLRMLNLVRRMGMRTGSLTPAS